MSLTRRSFLQRVGASVVAFTLARHLPGIAPAPVSMAAPSLQAGDAFTIEGKFRFNPQTRQPDPALGLQVFKVTAVTD